MEVSSGKEVVKGGREREREAGRVGGREEDKEKERKEGEKEEGMEGY